MVMNSKYDQNSTIKVVNVTFGIYLKNSEVIQQFDVCNRQKCKSLYDTNQSFKGIIHQKFLLQNDLLTLKPP